MGPLPHREKAWNRIDKNFAAIHADIIAFGSKLQRGRNLYEFDDIGFGDWVVRNKLDTIRIGERQQERSACMEIYRLHEIGYIEDPDADNGVARKLDLTGCERRRPTDIIKWARGCQWWLFNDLRAKASRPKKSRTPPLPTDEMPDFAPGGPLRELATALDRVSQTLKTLSDGEVISAIKKLEELLEVLKQRHKPAGKTI